MRLRQLFNSLHTCHFIKPIASQYRTFSSRDVIYECKCGKRKLFRVWRSFSDPFPIETNMLITGQEMDNILNGGPTPQKANPQQ